MDDHLFMLIRGCKGLLCSESQMTRATNQYSDAGRLQPPHSMFSQRGRDRPLGQLSLAYTGSSAGQEGGLCKPGYDCVCVVTFPGPCRPCTVWSCRGGNAVEAGGCHQHILHSLRLCVCACVHVCGAFLPPPLFLAWMVIWLRRFIHTNDKNDDL